MAYKRNVEIFEEAYTKKDDKSTLSYMARDGHRRYIPGSSDPDIEPGGGSSSIPVVEVEGDTPEQELAPNTFYKFGTVDSIDLTLGEGEEGVMNIYAFSFTASEDFDPSTGISWPEGVRLNGELEIEAGQECEVSIYDGKAAFMVWDAPEVETPDAPGEPVVDG